MIQKKDTNSDLALLNPDRAHVKTKNFSLISAKKNSVANLIDPNNKF